MVIAGELALGSLVAFLTYVWILADPAVAIGWVVNALQRGHSSLVRLYELIELDSTLVVAHSEPTSEPARTLQVRNLRFKFPPLHASARTALAEQDAHNEEPFELFIDRLDLRTGMRLGYLLNFAEAMMKTGITRTVNSLPE